jgi:hypothetical protein
MPNAWSISSFPLIQIRQHTSLTMHLYAPRNVGSTYHMQQQSQLPRTAWNTQNPNLIYLTSEEPSMLTGFTNTSELLELENSIKSIELDTASLNAAQSTISGETKQVIQATLSQSKEINAMQSEMGDIYSMLKELCNHLMPNILPLPLRPNYAAIHTSNETNNNTRPTTMLPP